MEPQEHASVIIMKELSEIRTNLAVNTNETQNIKSTITEVKTSVSQIQQDFVSRREFNDRSSTIEEQISPLKKIVYGCVALVLTGFVSSILLLIYK